MADRELLGTRIGRIRLVDFMAEGGMGAVYVGYDETLERKVAVKAIHAASRLHAEARARFKREARVLSSLAHPNICQIYDYIETEDRDFLVLELISGRNLKDCLDTIPSDVKRAEIAAEIVDVLLTAHSKGIVHRDLKPSNVMLTAEGTVKILDFGLARTADESLSTWSGADEPGQAAESSPSITRFGALLGTIEYMSPEQARGEPATTASDIYSLGLVLQELFTRRRPFEAGLETPDLLARARAGITLPVTGIDASWAALIDRLKSMAPASRPSAVDVAERIRYIRDRPRRRLRRLIVTTVIAVLVLVVTGLSVQTWRIGREAARANREAEVARQVSEFLVQTFSVSDPSESRGQEVTARELLDQAASRVDKELREQPVVRARLLHTIGRVYRSLGLYERSTAILDKSLRTWEEIPGHDPLDAATTRWELGNTAFFRADYAGAQAAYEQTLEIREQRLGASHPEVAQVLFDLGSVHMPQGDLQRADELTRRALDIFEASLGRGHVRTAPVLGNLGTIAYTQGELDRALDLTRRAFEINERDLGADHPETSTTRGNLAVIYAAKGDPRAIQLTRQNLATVERVMGSNHPQLILPLYNLAQDYVLMRDLQSAQPLVERSHAIAAARLGPEHPKTGLDLSLMAKLCDLRGDHAQARGLHEQAIRILEKTPDETTDCATVLLGYARSLLDAGELDRAVAIAAEAVRQRETRLGAENSATAEARLQLGRAQLARQEYDQARAVLVLARRVLQERSPRDRYERTLFANTLVACGNLAFAAGQVVEAREEWQRALGVVDSLTDPVGFDPPRARVEALLALGRVAESRILAEELLKSGYREASFVRLLCDQGLGDLARATQPN